MRRYTTPSGEERIWYDPGEIEQTMQAELGRAGSMPPADAPVVDIEKFVERHLRAHLDTYATLDGEVLGLTEFFVGAPPKILINGDLTDSALDDDDPAPGLRGRWRATVAHEAAHVILHRALYQRDDQTLDLFGGETLAEPARLHRCPKAQVSYRARANWDWREVQANRGMAALLMPRQLFGEIARTEVRRVAGSETTSAEGAISVARDLARRFHVSCQAAEIRLQTLGFVAVRGQATV